ncbi:MAG: hypothetical protein ACKOWF_09495 [Chloroflexota bacterium]
MTDTAPAPRKRRGYHRVGYLLSIILALTTVAMLPLIFSSVFGELIWREERVLYDGLTGQRVPETAGLAVEDEVIFIAISVLDIDRAGGMAALDISGNRTCPADGCQQVDITFYSLDDNVTVRRGLPPVQTVSLAPGDRMYSDRFTLPVAGFSNMYPFDRYRMWLGASVTETAAGGVPRELEASQIGRNVLITIQNLEDSLLMAQPLPISPDRVSAPTDPYAFITVLDLRFREPTYLVVLSILLVALISASGAIAIATRDYRDLVLGIGGLVLGVWGVRSVLAVSSTSGPTLLDLSLSLVILLLLLGFIVRSVRYFHDRAELPALHLPRVRTRDRDR